MQHIDDCRDKLIKVVSRLKRNTFDVNPKKRPLRALGQGLLSALCVIEGFGGVGGRIVSLLGGPTTIGPGRIIEDDLTTTYRTHADLEENTQLISEFKKANKFYEDLLVEANKYLTTIDLFAFSLVQFGIGEMRNLIDKTGGMVINQEEFISEVFTKSFNKYMEMILNPEAVYGAKTKVVVSKELFLSGMLGPGKSLEKTKTVPKDAEGLIGESGGDKFFIGAPLNTTTILFFFAHNQAELNVKSKPCFFQICTTFVNKKGETILRVANYMREFINNKDLQLQSFDQEAGIACIARLAAYKGDTIQVTDLVYWLNSVLIKFVRRFAQFQTNKPDSFSIPEEISLLP